MSDLHPALGALAALVGTWSGEGEGHYPTIAPFAYRETVTFAASGRPVLSYAQRTWRAGSDEPLHAESGWLRGQLEGRAELVVAQPTGLAETSVLALRDEDGALVLDGARAPLLRSPGARPVVDVRRRFVLAGDELRYDLWMTWDGHDDEHHLRAVLRRAAPTA
jgi:hypothetical protein